MAEQSVKEQHQQHRKTRGRAVEALRPAMGEKRCKCSSASKHGDGGQEVRGDEEVLVEVETIRDREEHWRVQRCKEERCKKT